MTSQSRSLVSIESYEELRVEIVDMKAALKNLKCEFMKQHLRLQKYCIKAKQDERKRRTNLFQDVGQDFWLELDYIKTELEEKSISLLSVDARMPSEPCARFFQIAGPLNLF